MIRVPVKAALWGIAAVLLVWIFWLSWLWSPERQAELHTRNLLQRVSQQDWVAVGEMLAPDFRDSWGQGKEEILRDAEDVARHFFSLRIGPTETPTVKKEAESIVVSARLGIYGSGTPIAQAIVEAAQELQEPFVFYWRKSGIWPWQWALSEAAQKELVTLSRPALQRSYGHP